MMFIIDIQRRTSEYIANRKKLNIYEIVKPWLLVKNWLLEKM